MGSTPEIPKGTAVKDVGLRRMTNEETKPVVRWNEREPVARCISDRSKNVILNTINVLREESRFSPKNCQVLGKCREQRQIVGKVENIDDRVVLTSLGAPSEVAQALPRLWRGLGLWYACCVVCASSHVWHCDVELLGYHENGSGSCARCASV